MLHAPFIKHDDRNETINSRTMHRLLIILSYTRRGKDRSTPRERPQHVEEKTATRRGHVCLRALSESKKNQASIKKTT